MSEGCWDCCSSRSILPNPSNPSIVRILNGETPEKQVTFVSLSNLQNLSGWPSAIISSHEKNVGRIVQNSATPFSNSFKKNPDRSRGSSQSFKLAGVTHLKVLPVRRFEPFEPCESLGSETFQFYYPTSLSAICSENSYHVFVSLL